jgi:hypothetical protein
MIQVKTHFAVFIKIASAKYCRVARLEEERESINMECITAEDRLATILYTIQVRLESTEGSVPWETNRRG